MSEFQNPWPAPLATRPLSATVTIPGSKSLSNRYLILAAMGRRPVTLVGLLRSRDTDLMMGALRSLGVEFQVDSDDETTVRVTPPSSGRFTGDVDVYCGLAGTVMRFVPGLAMFADGPVRFDGDAQAYARPMKPVLDGLEQLGARIEYHGEPGRLPFTLTPPVASDGTNVPTHAVSIDASGSSQFISGLLLIGARLSNGLELHHTGDHLPSLPHIRMTVADLQSAGVIVDVDEEHHRWRVHPGSVQLPDRVVVEPDLSNAAPFLGAALIAGGTVSVPYWPRETTQPGGLLPGILQTMGAEITWDGRPWSEATTGEDAPAAATLTVRGDGMIRGLGRFDMSAAGEIAPSIAALAALADAPTQLVGIAHLRGHETNRLAALVTEIRRIGAEAEELEDGIEIRPVPRERLHGAVMETYADHRMATFAAMIGLTVPDIAVVDVATTRKTIPDFVGLWSAMLD
ncbi:3-phosphoshikimate 1-carboxyvinyltransferase [Bifidobacterium pullorum subsp. saeculare]|uniref:3-phosphoshikimate 1-carboxyvinyltransferase n=1 Tax=Bifidobacterium pullorum TaxID=78448 RepID=UPI00195971E0|nr:3-phosphoshikimate 1-carboxyvinyltransferase [Bifidobacterium pullorum]MBM6729766.1 3-phosphoshikimate 1-carboxyvinyltransferase [Bifidobacterium pullorum subsp. saeculare]